MTERRITIAAVALMVLAVALRSRHLAESFWIDEVLTMKYARTPFVDHFATAWPPLYRAAMHVWLNLFGTAEDVARLPSLVFGLTAIPLLFAIGRLLFNARVALIAVAFLTLSAFQIQYAVEARYYALLQLAVLGSTYAYVRVRADGGARWLWAHALLSIAAVETHYFAVLTLLAQALHTLACGPALRHSWRWLASIAVAAGIVALRLALFHQTVAGTDFDPMAWLPMPNWSTSAATLAAFLGWPQAAASTIAAAAVMLWAAVTGLTAVRRDEQRRSSLCFVWLATLTVLLPPLLASFALRSVYHDRYLIAAAPMLYLIIAERIVALPAATLRIAALATILAPTLLGTWRSIAEDIKPSWSQAATFIAAQARAGDVVWVAPVPHEQAFKWYYDGAAPVCGLLATPSGDAPKLWPPCLPSNGRLFVLASYGVRYRQPRLLSGADKLQRAGWTETIGPKLRNIEIRRLDPPPPSAAR